MIKAEDRSEIMLVKKAVNPSETAVHTGPERRVFVRYTCNQPSQCHSIQPGETARIQATILNASVGGLRLLTEMAFEKGELLSIELEKTAEALDRKLFVRVVYANSEPEGGWAIGCKLVKKLTEEELSGVLTAW
jgi:hypothetical protein